MTNTIQYAPCELILKVGSNEYDEIYTAITSLLRTCSISDQSFFIIERQVQPTTHFGTFTSQLAPVASSASSKTIATIPIQSQSLSCVLLLTDDIIKQQQLVRPSKLSPTNANASNFLPKSKHFFKSAQIWNFHHKIELLDENKLAIARQDYYELSYLLPLWSVSHIPHSRHPIVRFNIFTRNFDTMLTFYTRLFRRKPDSSKPGFALFVLTSSPHIKIIYQFSIKYSPSIQPYSIAQNAYFKFRLNNLDHFINEYSTKLFTLNKFEYYIYDPEGNLLHLYLYDLSNVKSSEETNQAKSLIHTNDSGVGETSDPPTTNLFSSIVPQGYKPFYPLKNDQEQQPTIANADIDVQSHSSQSSHDSGRWSSMSSNELNSINRIKRTVHHIPITIVNSKSVLPSTIPSKCQNNDEETIHNYRLRQHQQRTVPFHTNMQLQEKVKISLYDSEPRLSNMTAVNNRCYSSMNDVHRKSRTRQLPINCAQTTNYNYFQLPSVDNDGDISYEVDSPRIENEMSTVGYLNAFLMKKRQQQQNFYGSNNIQNSTDRYETSNSATVNRRPLSAPLVDQTRKPMKGILQRRVNGTITPIPNNKSSRKRSKSVTFECNSDENIMSSTDDDRMKNLIDPMTSPRINIGITLDSRLRKTPALEMLRSTTMASNVVEPKQLNRTTSLKQQILPIARF